jgi:Ca-activated chloride channel family protein
MRILLLAAAFAAVVPAASARGLMVPSDKQVPPLAMVNHIVDVKLEDQVAITTFEQTFRNHTDRNLEATYIFPVPKGASVNKFTMWIDGKETSGELLDAKKAHSIYTEIVRRTQDPGLLEYMGNSMMKLRVFPIPPKGDQKIKVSFTSVSNQDGGIVEYLYPLKTDGVNNRTLEKFSVTLHLKSQHAIQSIYSPTHAIDIKRKGEKEAVVEFEKNQALLDKDFQLFYGLGNKEVGLTPVLYRPVASEDGYFMLLISPQTETMKTRVPRDMVLVLDTSGSMSDLKMSQAKKALRQCLGQLGEKDRFSIISFATAVRTFNDGLVEANSDQLEKANKWVDDLRTSGGTAIQPALNTALDMRTKDDSRPFTVVFFTDGQATVDERDPVKIVKNVTARNTANTRIFTFGVGDDVNAAMLDQLAEATRAVTTYVRPAEDIEVKAASMLAKISHPVMTNVRLTTTNVKLNEVYPQQLPDLFHGGQLVVFGRYSGTGHAAIKLSGKVGSEEKEIVYELDFPSRTEGGRDFIEHLWARRKVGYILDQIRINGESKELVEEATALAKKYGIATPYTSYLVVPDGPLPVVPPPGRFHPMPAFGPMGGAAAPAGLAPGVGGALKKVAEFAKDEAGKAAKPGEGIANGRGIINDNLNKEQLEKLSPEDRKSVYAQNIARARDLQATNDAAKRNFDGKQLAQNQTGKVGVDLALTSCNLKEQSRLTQTANKQAYGRNCVELGGVWIDDKFDAKVKTLAVKAQSDAYFRILEKQPKMKDVFQLGNHLVWIAPSGVALIVDTNDGAEALDDTEIDALFVAAK